ncbi:CotH kinase family protein [Candidatus Poribacteria bacterium]|nr:CotH kinase family protein [Candidatus Poribacteria bacterium]
MTKWTVCLATLFCLGVAIHSSSAKELTLNDIFPTDRVIDVQITVPQRDWDTIRHQSRDFMTALGASRQFKPMESPYTYVEASVSIDGIAFPKVGLRKKGFIGSLSSTRPSLKIKLNHIDKEGGIEGLTNLTLNNNKQDTSLMSQFMGYALFNAIGSPAPRCAYAKVTVNGESLGIYSHVETVRKPLLKRAFGNSKGPLYEGTVVDFYEGWGNSFEHKRGDDTRGRAHINALIDLLADPKATEADIGELIDLESFYKFWAAEGVVGFWDGYSGNKNNFFVYLNPEDSKFHFTPWGMDSIFTKMSKLEFMNDRRAPISVKTQGLIAYKLYQFESGRKRYAEALTEILDNHWNAPELLATLDKAAVMVEPHLVPAQRVIQEDWGRRGGWGRESKKPTFASELEEVRDFVRNRKSDLQAEIADGMPVWRKRPEPPFVIAEDGDFMKNFLKSIEDTIVGAARMGDLEAIKQHIAGGADVNALHFEMPPLTWAAVMGQTEAAELLLQHGANVNGRNRDDNTALHLAMFLGRAETTELLLRSGADVNAKNDDGATPVDTLQVPWEMTKMLAGFMGVELEQEQVEAGKAKIREMFSADAKIGAEVPSNSENNSEDLWAASRTSSSQRLSAAAFTGDVAAMKQALTDGADPNTKDPQSGSTLLATAALMGHTEVVALLLQHGADIDARSQDGGTALHAAAFLGRAETVKLLLDKGADTTLRSNMGGTAIEGAKLNWLITKGILAMLKLEVNEVEVKAGRAEVIKLLEEHNK